MRELAGRLGSWLWRWLLAVLATAALGSIVQTQFNMAAIRALGAPVSLLEQFQATAQDLMGFAPLWAALVAISLLVAFLIAGLLQRLRPSVAAWLYPLAGLAALAALIGLLHLVLPMTPIAATRSIAGSLLMALPGLLGGWLFVRLRDSSASPAV